MFVKVYVCKCVCECVIKMEKESVCESLSVYMHGKGKG